jgi:hypothetical protein
VRVVVASARPDEVGAVSEQPDVVTAADDQVQLYAYGLVACSVCAPSNLTRDEVEKAVNVLHPTGIDSPWRISSNPRFHGGGEQPGPCNYEPAERTHYLMEC